MVTDINTVSLIKSGMVDCKYVSKFVGSFTIL